MTTYRDAGVDIDAGEEVVRRIKPLVRRTFSKRVLTDIGAFGGFFQPDLSSYETPVLVSSVDGVGTKLKVAFMTGRHDTVGQDLVNHCVNDIAVCAATPLFFLDYFATGRLNVDDAEAIISGFAIACEENGCALIGGETAEMPGIYDEGEYDLSGTVVGIVERSRIIDGSAVRAGDRLVGLPSTGLHTNGYSLARKVLFDRFDPDSRPDVLNGETVADALLRVHRSYLKAIGSLTDLGGVTGFVHVTGGGIPGNSARIIRHPLVARVDYESWERPEIFRLIQETGAVPETDMRRTFNLGVGLIIVVRPASLMHVLKKLESHGETPFEIGEVVEVEAD